MTDLFQSERQRQIAALTLDIGRVEVAELAERFKVTTETIRRDLSELQTHRLVRRVHGGAVPWERSRFEPLLANRAVQNAGAKRRLAHRAVEELPDSGTVIIDSGSTLSTLAQVIPDNSSLRIVTNSLVTAQELSSRSRIDVFVLGGRVHKNTLAMVDSETIAAVQRLSVDTLFVSADAVTATTGLTTPYREEAALKSTMIAAAKRVVTLVDHSKFGDDQFIRFASWDDIDVLVTNHEVDPEVIAAIEATGTTVALC